MTWHMPIGEQARVLRDLDRLIWAIVAAITALVLLVVPTSRFRIAWGAW